MMEILVLHGPNLNLLGQREPEIYGPRTLEQIDDALKKEAERLGVELRTFQSNHEGALIDRIQAAHSTADGLIINPGGLTHSSVSLRDAILAVGLPTIEVHLSNIHAREQFRRRSLTGGACLGVISGLGWRSYILAVNALVDRLGESG